jgi:protein-tyrosine-phosphatase
VKYRKILFVCTGNSCRSPIAKALLEKISKDIKLEIEVDSAGTSVVYGMKATDEAIELLRKEGIDISQHRAKPVTKELLRWADLILTMEDFHKEKIINENQDLKEKVFLFKEFIEGKNENIFDPIGKPKEVYEELIITFKNLIPKIIEKIK